jgi:hypothetical protein
MTIRLEDGHITVAGDANYERRKRLQFLPARSLRHLMLKSWKFPPVCSIYIGLRQARKATVSNVQKVECRTE